MRRLQFTREDLNEVFNFGDVRASELSVLVNEIPIDSWEFASDFVSIQDVITDYVSARKLKELLEPSDSYIVKFRRTYPWHEAFADDCIELSRTHLHAYVPIVVAMKDATLGFTGSRLLPRYSRELGASAASFSANEVLAGDLSCQGKGMFVIYEPDSRVHREALTRLRRRRLSLAQDRAAPRFLRSDAREFVEITNELVKAQVQDEIDADSLTTVLLQMWPCGAFGRLSSYLYMKEGVADVVAELVTWNSRPEAGGIRALGRDLIAADGPASAEIVANGLKRSFSAPRSKDTDRLCLSGITRYRPDDWRARGWPVLASALDPLVMVRSDGVYRWMCMPHGGLESIERLEDGENRAVGTSFIATNYSRFFEGKRALFGGLGLGVLQRQMRCSVSLTVEVSDAVIELYEHLYCSSCRTLEVNRGEIFEFLRRDPRKWDAIVIDFFDPSLSSLSNENLGVMLKRLTDGGRVFVNLQGAREPLTSRIIEAKSSVNVDFELHSLEHDQTVACFWNRS